MRSKRRTDFVHLLPLATVSILFGGLIVACSQPTESAVGTDTSRPFSPSPNLPSATVQPSPSPTSHDTTPIPATETPSLDAWQFAPILPEVSAAMREVYERGQSLGNDPHAFSKIGDSETFTSWFLAPFDQHPPTYDLGPYTELQAVIDYFQGSFARQSLAARQGFNAASVFAPLWADPAQCEAGETPLACEFRVHHPSFVFILLGTNDYLHLDEFEEQMRRIIEFSLDQGVVPIIGLKADNLEGNHSINRTLYRLAVEYQLPLWNFWRAVQGLPFNGLDEDQAHLTFGVNEFGNPDAMQRAWPVRNLTALQSLDRVWRGESAP
ncbi:MAG: SGNH/GDSL hydrolase family protein [Anaerolineales bacterium]|jgi:hypothetical protein